ncbi:pitrilysin family protein [Sulfurimonas sp. HSL1-6]|uniref:M16 family metallopeptidase n=1 Tax=Thiomicrolovo immobilis TaxID=3131935 RepID=UPI0031F96551
MAETTVEQVEVNGIKVPMIFEHDSRLPIVSMQLVFRQSGSIEDGAHAGLAKVSASMLNEGTQKRGAVGFAEALDARAIHLSVHAGTETMVFEMGSLKEEFGEAVGLLEELLTAPNLSKEALQKVKTTMVGALSRKENDFDYVANRELRAMLFTDTPLASPASGTVESVKAMELKTVKAFVENHLQASRAIVVIGGDISKTDAEDAARRLLSTLPKGALESLGYYPASAAAQTELFKRKTEQAYVYFGAPFEMKVGDAEHYISRVAMFILGSGGFGSRMMEEVRVKRGLAYSAYCRANIARSNSYFFGYLQTKIASQKEAVETVREVIDTFIEKGATQEELDQAKRFLLGSEPLRVETLSQRLSRTFLEYYKGEGIGASARELAQIETLDLATLNAFIKKHKEIEKLTFSIVTEE